MHQKNIIRSGQQMPAASKVLILLHGRGGSAEDILSLSQHLDVHGFALLAPQATSNTWYPFSFLAPLKQNQPWLSSALGLLKELLDEITGNGVPTDHIYFGGFSQGACLTLEFVARNAAKYGGVVAFTGGLIGDKISPENYLGDFQGTPVFIGTSDPDPHVPVERVYATSNILRNMHADVTLKVYANMGHTITQNEIELANKIVFHANRNENL